MARIWLVWVCLAACGRVGFDGVGEPPLPDAPGAITGEADAAPVACPNGMALLGAGFPGVCIELAERAAETWLGARDRCLSVGRRLCTTSEWTFACTGVAGMQAMTGAFEWLAEESGGLAESRGAASCTDAALHDIDSVAFELRCCLDP
jgi:hypothetical protein